MRDWVAMIPSWASPRQGTTWADWIGWAANGLSKGDDMLSARS